MFRKVVGVLALAALSVATFFVTSAIAAKRSKPRSAQRGLDEIPASAQFVPYDEARLGPRPVPEPKHGGPVRAYRTPDGLVKGQSKVHLHPQAAGGNAALYHAFAQAFSTKSPRPADRLTDYHWIEAAGHEIVAWDAVLMSMQPSNGGWTVTVVVNPQMSGVKSGAGLIGHTLQNRKEVYYFVPGVELSYVRGEVTTQGGLIMFD